MTFGSSVSKMAGAGNASYRGVMGWAGKLVALLVPALIGGCEREARPREPVFALEDDGRAERGSDGDAQLEDAGSRPPVRPVRLGPATEPGRICLNLRNSALPEISNPPTDEELAPMADALRSAAAGNRVVAIEPGTSSADVDAVVEALRAAGVDGVSVEQAELGSCGIRSIMRSALPGIRECYEAELLAEPDLAGIFVARVAIEKLDGRVLEVARDPDSTFDNDAASDCILGLLRELEFPASPAEGRINVRYPFELRPSERGGAAQDRTAE